jgi:O-antigen ligase
LPIYAFYVFAKEKIITEKNLEIIILFFFCLVTIKYFQTQQDMLAAALLVHSSKEEFTNNVGYSFLALIPACVYFYKRPLLQYVSLGYCMVFLLMGMKRGAIFIGAICLVCLLWKNLTNASKKRKIGVLLLSVVLCFVGYSAVQKQMEESLLFQKRLEETLEGNTSHRDDLYSYFLNYFWNETSPLQFVFGSGANATLKISNNYAHNDWLEIAVNQGFLGLIIYAFYWLIFAKSMFQNYSPQPKLALQLLFIIYFLKTIFSMSYEDMTVPATFILGFSLAQEKKNEQIVYCN